MARKDTTFISMEYSPDEVRSRLGQVGIAKGFFTISVGGKKQHSICRRGKKVLQYIVGSSMMSVIIIIFRVAT